MNMTTPITWIMPEPPRRGEMESQSESEDSDGHMWSLDVEEQVLAKAQALAEARARALAVTWALEGVGVQAQARARALAQAEALAQALAPWTPEIQVKGDGLKQTWGDGLKQTWAERWAEAQAEARKQTWAEAQAHIFTYGDVLADSDLMDIINSIATSPEHIHKLTHDLWRSQENWWLIQVIAPITRLPLELLQQILLIIIDKTSHSPLPLMQVCKLWYTVVIGIWAPLKLETRTPKDAVTRKLKRNQRFLDVLVDMEIDRGDLIPSKGAFEAIFSTITASSRWRTFVVETLPTQADLPGHLVNRGL